MLSVSKQDVAATIAHVEMPARVRRLPRDERGFPVPRFVQWLKDGEAAERAGEGAEADFRYADFEFRNRAFKQGLCWVCGEPLGQHQVYVIGPMCVVSRTTMEPACHRDCAEYAAKACPFLVKPRMRRRTPTTTARAPGIMIKRNPGCVCLYETLQASPFNDGKGGWLIKLGRASRVDWWAEGRKATRAEILASIDSGYPLLEAEAKKGGPGELRELEKALGDAMALLPGE